MRFRALILSFALFAILVAGANAQIIAEDCGSGVARFHASADARDASPPSLCLVQPLFARGPAPENFGPRPVFRNVNGRPAATLDIEDGTSLYGTGEVPGDLQRNGWRTTAWNTDAYGYGVNSMSLYQSHPWVLGVRADGSAFGVIADTPQRCHIDLRKGILFVADGPEFPIIVIDGESPQTVLGKLADLTGHMPLPPRWALGYHQCRYSYYPDERVREIARAFRERDIPCDTIWLDIDYMDGFRSFTFSPEHFPDPPGLMDALHEDGYHVITMIDPGLKLDPGWPVYDSGNAIDAWVKDASNQTFVGRVWPGDCVFPDFTRVDVRRWWAGLYEPFLEFGMDGIWNDMNEPAVFDIEGHTMPSTNLHAADIALGGPGDHRRYHNVYGMLMVRASREGIAAARPAKRPFVLTRANHLGGQRYAATWTGDNLATWEHLDFSIPMILNLGLSGQPFSGPDIGGFGGAGDGEMFARWMGIGALMPFARGHTGKGNIDKEPWAFGPEVEATCRRALQRRSRLMPYLYTLFREAAETGMPVMRPLFFADPTDARLRTVDDDFLLGDAIWVEAQTQPTLAPRDAGSRWTRFDLGVDDADDPQLPRLYLRAGHILPLGPMHEHVQQAGESDPLELVLRLDSLGQAAGVLYEDAGDGFGFRDDEAYREILYTARRQDGELRIEMSRIAGRLDIPDRPLLVRVLLEDGAVALAEGRDGESLSLTLPR